jgi:hypothetical protein
LREVAAEAAIAEAVTFATKVMVVWCCSDLGKKRRKKVPEGATTV